jgi:hypothetical protein
MSKSEQNLQDAFAGESQANRKYLAFAKKADQEDRACPCPFTNPERHRRHGRQS